ncbi:unnamed protein product, partial [Soboliphyme baturini]|uniref:DUF2013 domain-containing protein n=1 Tax=Soboliphyme baturini TaxID=241478 RepID=A0A183J9I7_9BILA
MFEHDRTRPLALMIMQQLLTNPNCEDDLVRMLALLNSSALMPITPKIELLRIKYSSLTDSLRLLGCFARSDKLTIVTLEDDKSTEAANDVLVQLYEIFTWKIEDRETFPDHSLPRSIAVVCYIVRLLYNMAFDSFDSRKQKQKNGVGSSLLIIPPVSNDLILVHPGAIMCMTELLLYIHHEDSRATLGMQIYLLEVLKSALRSERNQQVMCQEGLPALLVKIGAPIFLQEDHPLLPPFFYIFERLAAQCMEPNEIWNFLRLADPLCCADLDDNEDNGICSGGPVALSRVKTLVSMMTPRDLRLSWM